MAAASDADRSDDLLDQVRQAIAARTPLFIRGGGSKAHLGRFVDAPPLSTLEHRGIVNYDPAELVVTARAGTRVADVVMTLVASGQSLPFEPPRFSAAATVGGMVAAGLSGPRRPWAGAVRDFVLGTRLITGLGTHLRFGGEVMKNVAGYDLSRTLAGSHGCLGLITEVSLKVLPLARHTRSLLLPIDEPDALRLLREWDRTALPVTGACWWQGRLHVRMEGGRQSVEDAAARIGGSELPIAFWDELRDHALDFFRDPRPLWRLSLPATTKAAPLPGDALADWGGAQRWLKTDVAGAQVRDLASRLGGHAECHTSGAHDSPFHPLAPGLLRYHQQLKHRLDPHGIFNPGRMYADL